MLIELVAHGYGCLKRIARGHGARELAVTPAVRACDFHNRFTPLAQHDFPSYL